MNAVELDGFAEECLLVQDMCQSKLDLMSKQITDIRDEMIELDRRSAERSESRMKEQRKGTEEDLIKPLTLKTENIERLQHNSGGNTTAVENWRQWWYSYAITAAARL